MTEDEAKTKACCGPRVGAHAAISIAGGGHSDPIPRCIASACMAWRWSEEFSAMRFVSASGGNIPDDDGATSVLRQRHLRPGERLGYCGLAGGVVHP